MTNIEFAKRVKEIRDEATYGQIDGTESYKRRLDYIKLLTADLLADLDGTYRD